MPFYKCPFNCQENCLPRRKGTKKCLAIFYKGILFAFGGRRYTAFVLNCNSYFLLINFVERKVGEK